MAPEIKIVTLGAGQHVGRSCILLSIGRKNLMLDCGMHMGFNDEKKFPDFSFLTTKSPEFSKKIDCLIISHFHLDHCGALPYFTEICGFDGPIIMTYPTKAICPILLEDYRKIAVERQGATNFYSADDIENCMKKVRSVNVHESVFIDNELEIKCFYAGHVLGAAIFLIKDLVSGGSVVYTGDFNMTPDRHLGAAQIDLSDDVQLNINSILNAQTENTSSSSKNEKKIDLDDEKQAEIVLNGLYNAKVDCLITETTYSTKIRDSKASRERDFLQVIHDTVIHGGGKALIPVFALGRVQELCILIETYWERMGIKIPVYFSAGLAEKATDYYKLFIQWTNQKIKQTFTQKKFNFFQFKHIKPFNRALIDNAGPCVLFATPGMLHAGMSLEIFRKWCENSNNCVIFAGHCVKGTIGARVLDMPLPTPENYAAGLRRIEIEKKKVDVRCKIFSISFSAHADHKGILQIVHQIKPRNLFLVHGDKERMKFLKEQIINENGIPCFAPENGETVTIPIIPKMHVLVSSSLLENALKNSKVIENSEENEQNSEEGSSNTDEENISSFGTKKRKRVGIEGVLVVKNTNAKKKRKKNSDANEELSLKDSIPTILSLKETDEEIISLKKHNIKFSKQFLLKNLKSYEKMRDFFEELSKILQKDSEQILKPNYFENDYSITWSLNTINVVIPKKEFLLKLSWAIEDEGLYQTMLPSFIKQFNQ